MVGTRVSGALTLAAPAWRCAACQNYRTLTARIAGHATGTHRALRLLLGGAADEHAPPCRRSWLPALLLLLQGLRRRCAL